MPRFPSMEWAQALVKLLELDPTVLPALRDWGGKSVGIIVGKDKGLAQDFCVYAKPHATEPRLLELKLCEDEDDLDLEEPDYLFRAPFGTARQLLTRQLDALEVITKGQIQVVGDVKLLVTLGQKHRHVGERALAKIETTY